MRILVVDDEPPARKRLIRLLQSCADAEVVGEATNGREALEQIRATRPDLVFLDIRMPGLDGLAVARQVETQTSIVFTTAYDEYAVQAFEANAVDYLLKPVQEKRLAAALERVRQRDASESARVAALVRKVLEGQEREAVRVTARIGNSVRVFDPREIARFHAEDRYTTFLHQGKQVLVDETLNSLESRLAPLGFLRVHRAELVNLHRVSALHSEDGAAELELVDGQRVPVSRRQAPELRRRLGLRDTAVE